MTWTLTDEEFEQLEMFLRHVVSEATARGGPKSNVLFNHWQRMDRTLREVRERARQQQPEKIA